MNKITLFLLFLISITVDNSFAQDLLVTNNGDSIRCKINKYQNGFLVYSTIKTPDKLKEMAISKIKYFEHTQSSELVDSLVLNDGSSLYCTINSFKNNSFYYLYLSNNSILTYDSIGIDEVAIFKAGVKKNTIGRPVAVTQTSINIDKITYGLGLGFDYGGIGLNILYYPQKNIGLWASGGTVITGLGYNLGLKCRFFPKYVLSKSHVYLLGMYGYNAVIKEKIFYGPSIGLGFDYRHNPDKNDYWSFALLVPFRGSEIMPYLNSDVILLPFTISIGYKVIIK